MSVVSQLRREEEAKRDREEFLKDEHDRQSRENIARSGLINDNRIEDGRVTKQEVNEVLFFMLQGFWGILVKKYKAV